MQSITRMILLAALTSGAIACTDTDSATNLNPAGPPMLRQVRMTQRVIDANDPNIQSTRRVFGFGSHELAFDFEVVDRVSTAVALNDNLRLVIDELLVGNNLEEIECRISPNDPATGRIDNFQTVPIGANPDDIARCSVADDVLFSSCQGNTAVCMCQNPMGCARGTQCDDGDPTLPRCSAGSQCLNNICVVDFGQPVGVKDENQDGGVDSTRMIEGAVKLQCGSIDVPIEQDLSYWNPSGDQNKPAMGGFEALGPAIVLVTNGPMPTNLDCGIAFADNVVDKEGNRVCAPQGGDVNLGCEPGDLTAFGFKTEALFWKPASFLNGDTGLPIADSVFFAANTNISAMSLTAPGAITIKEGGAGGTDFTAFTIKPMMATLIEVDWDTQLLPNTEYELTITPTLTDTFGQGVPAPQVFTFTTGAN